MRREEDIKREILVLETLLDEKSQVSGYFSIGTSKKHNLYLRLKVLKWVLEEEEEL